MGYRTTGSGDKEKIRDVTDVQRKTASVGCEISSIGPILDEQLAFEDFNSSKTTIKRGRNGYKQFERNQKSTLDSAGYFNPYGDN